MAHIVFLIFLSLSAFSDEKVCSTVIIHGKEKMDLNETEKRLVCGDKKVDAYKDIPTYQASYLMVGFLQSRGFLKPEFETVDGVLHVHPGKKAKLKKVTLASDIKEEKFIKEEVNRRYRKKVLSPGLIGDVEKESKTILRQRGYPCAVVESSADADTNEIGLQFSKTVYHTFGDVKREKIEGLRDNALDRYYPYDGGDAFDERLLDLNEKRMLRAEVVQGTYYLEDCSEDAKEFSLAQEFMVGPPRTIRFGVGASTELGPMARVVWSHNRSGSMASTIQARIQGSLRSQSLVVTADTFVWKESPRRSLYSELNITRESQIDYEQSLFRLTPASVKWTRDGGEHGWTWILGPTLESGTYFSKDKSQTRAFNTAVLEGSFNLMAHNYELFDIHPEEGDLLDFKFGFRHPSLGFSDPSLRLDSSYVKLARLSEMGRGTIIGGFRIGAGTLVISDKVASGDLPPAVKFYGGGSDDIRGYLLNTLPKNDGIGAITRTSLKLELRRTYFFHEKLESFVFLDAAYFGDQSFKTDETLFYSPGFGLRWKSPIGMIQGYWARALTLAPNEDNGNFLYAGLGGTF